MEEQQSEETKATLRMQIAQDVIKQLNEGRFIAKQGQYVSLVSQDGYHVAGWSAFAGRDIWTNGQYNSETGGRTPEILGIKELVADKQCAVCAKGGLFVAKVDRFNAITTNQMTMPDDRGIVKYLNEFSEEQLLLIEFAFEGREFIEDQLDGEGCGCGDPYCDVRSGASFDEERQKCADFTGRFPDANDRMRAIMQNVVDNGGTFVP